MNNTTRFSTRLLAAAGAAILCTAAACSKGQPNQQTANGSVDTTASRFAAVVPAEGPGVQVTRTDDRSVTKATEYELTSDNFAHFMAAADSIGALEQRDSTVRAYLSQDITGSGASQLDAGRKWLDANPKVSAAINNAGISTEDYYVQSLAIAAAERFMADPKSAPPTPALTKNAEFLRGHQADLTTLHSLRAGTPVMTVTPKGATTP